MAIQNSTNTIIVSYGNGSMTFNKSLSSVESTAAVDGETTSTGEESTINWWITEGE